MRLKKYNEFITENANWSDRQIQGSMEFLSENPDYNWIVLDETGRPVSGWEYLRDGILDGIMYDNLDEGVDDWDVEEEVDEFLDEYGYGEPDDDMDDYEQDELDGFVSKLKSKYGYFPDNYDRRLVKREEVEAWEIDDENPNIG